MERKREARRPGLAMADERMDVPGVIDGRRRVVVERLQPEIDGGRFPIKRSVGERVRVTVDLFADGHDLVAGAVRYRHRSHDGGEAAAWEEVRLVALGNDSWGAEFPVSELG